MGYQRRLVKVEYAVYVPDNDADYDIRSTDSLNVLTELMTVPVYDIRVNVEVTPTDYVTYETEHSAEQEAVRGALVLRFTEKNSLNFLRINHPRLQY